MRLRIPPALAVAVLGVSAAVAASFGGCEEGTPEPRDAGVIEKVRDAGLDGGENDAGDGGPVSDAAGGETDAALADAYVPPPDAAPT